MPVELTWNSNLVDASDNHDIEFTILGPLPVRDNDDADEDKLDEEEKNGDTVPVPVLVRKRSGQKQTIIAGTVSILLPGRYVLKWDNSYSWFASKEIHYACSLKQVEK